MESNRIAAPGIANDGKLRKIFRQGRQDPLSRGILRSRPMGTGNAGNHP
jgi:hypothetical protein